MAKSILVISDGHETSNCSLKKARDIAGPLGEKIEVVRFMKTDSNNDVDSDAITALSSELNQAITDIFADYERHEFIESQIIVTDDIVNWVTNYCEGKEFDLIVKAGHRSETFFHTPCDWELIRSLKIPVLIASQERWRNKHNVLAAINPSPKNEAHRQLNATILHWSKKWADTFGASLHVVYCLPVSKILKELDIIDLEEYAQIHRQEGEDKLDTLLREHGISDAKIHITAGSPDRTIPHCANEIKAELVVMGSTGRSGIKSIIFGNVTEKVMHNLRTDSLSIELQDS